MSRFAPKDYQIIGFDGLKSAIDQDYYVSSIKQSTNLLAKSAVDSLLSLIDGHQPDSRIVLPVSFVDGGTTRKPKFQVEISHP